MSTPYRYRHDRGAPLHERLTLCITVLRDMADKNGYGKNIDMRNTLTSMTGMTDSQARYYMASLKKLGVYKASGGRDSSYQLNLDIPVITYEMTVGLSLKHAAPAIELSSSIENELVRNLVPVTNYLASLILELEAKVARLEAQLIQQEGGRQNVDSGQNTAMHTLDPRVIDILRRYSGSD